MMQVNLTVNVDETLFNDELKSQLEALKPEEVKEVLLKCIYEYFSKDNYANMEKLIVEDDHNNYYYGNKKVATEFTKKLIEECDYSKLQEVVDVYIERLKTNHKSILNDLLLDALVNGLTERHSFRSSLNEALYRIRNNQ